VYCIVCVLCVGGQSDSGDQELNERRCQSGNNLLPVFIKGNIRLLQFSARCLILYRVGLKQTFLKVYNSCI